jgi:D-arabinose 1-dehydrogenase-like Zn-dependent alcohol dehydrogenase
VQAADRLGIRPQITPNPLEEADRALDDLAAGHVVGAAVLAINTAGVAGT